jgi:hypothetical protein
MNNYDIVWIRWYKMYSDGMTPSSDHNYTYQWFNKGDRTPDEMYSMIEMDIDESINLYEEGEHYRCFRWEYIDRPPEWYIIEQIKYFTKSIKVATQMLEYFESIQP